MADDIDGIVKNLQEAVLTGYSQRFKDEFYSPRNFGKIESPDG